MFSTEMYFLYCLYFDELGPCVYNKLKMLQVLDFHEMVNMFLTYMGSFYVETISTQRSQHVKF